MDTFSPETHFDALYYALGGDFARLQPFVDAILADYNNLDIAGFSFNDDLLDDFTFEQVENYVGIAPLAAVVDPDSPAIPFGRKGQSLGTGKIPRMKTVEYLNEAKVRTLKKLIRRRDVTAQMVQDSAGASIGEIIANQVASFTNALTYQRDQMVSTGGVIYNATNNPYGINLTLSARVPSANKIAVNSGNGWFAATTYAAVASSDPVQDMKDLVEVARKAGLTACHFEMNNLVIDRLLNHTQVIADIKERFSLNATYTVSSLKPFTRNEQIAALEALVGKPIVEKDHISSVEYNDGGVLAERSFSSFSDANVVLVPDGNIGEILTVEPMLFEGGRYAFAFGRKAAFTIGTDYVKKCQSYSGEMTSVVAPDKPRLMFYLTGINAS